MKRQDFLCDPVIESTPTLSSSQGGVAFFLNPEPVAPFIDCFLIGEAEAIVPRFFDTKLPDLLNQDRTTCLKTLARNVPGTYVPEFYNVTYHSDGTFHSVEPLVDVPVKIEHRFLKDLSRTPTCSTVLTPDTTFDRTFLIEVGRGCAHGCRFCSTGFVYRPPRFRPLSLLQTCLRHGVSMTDKIGLVGASVSDHPEINTLCNQKFEKNIRISFSSFRADALSPELLSVLRESKVKTATIARMRVPNGYETSLTRASLKNISSTLLKPLWLKAYPT